MSAQKQQTSNIIPYPSNAPKSSVENVSIFHNEEQVIRHATEVFASYETHEHPIIKEYLLLLNNYKKLLKQTKFLVKISDKQQKDKTRQAEEVVETSEKRLAQFLEAVSVGIFVVDAQGKPHYANHKAQQIFGTNPTLCQNVAQMPEVCRAYRAGTQELYPIAQNPILLAVQGYTCSVDDIEIHHDDKVTPIAVWSTPIFDEKGNVIYAISAFQDISLQKQHEAQLKLQNEALVKLNQEKNEFLGIVAHDLKNPLSAILGIAEETIESFNELSQGWILESAELTQRISKQMFDLIANLLDVNAIESGYIQLTTERIDIVPIMRQLLHDYTERAESKYLNVHFHPTQENFIAFVDKNIVHQVLDNVVSNAIKYSPRCKHVFIRMMQTDQVVRCEIEDQGQGLNDHDLKNLFGKFKRLTPKPTAGEHSTGLGLFIVKKLVEAMHGVVWCESELGKGSKFIIEFPLGS